MQGQEQKVKHGGTGVGTGYGSKDKQGVQEQGVITEREGDAGEKGVQLQGVLKQEVANEGAGAGGVVRLCRSRSQTQWVQEQERRTIHLKIRRQCWT